MKTNKLIVTTHFAWLIYLISLPIHAGVLFDSSANPIFDLDPVSADSKINASFITQNQPTRLSFLTLRWRKDQDQTGNIHILLREDKNGYPGAVVDNLATVDSRSLPLGDQWLTIPFKNTKEISVKTRYWIEIAATGDSGSMAYSREKVGEGIATESYLNKYGLNRNTETGPYIFKLEGIEH